MPRRKAPRTPGELAAHIKKVGGVHAHQFYYTHTIGWKFAFRKTKKKCGTDQCFVMRLKNVEETERPQG